MAIRLRRDGVAGGVHERATYGVRAALTRHACHSDGDDVFGSSHNSMLNLTLRRNVKSRPTRQTSTGTLSLDLAGIAARIASTCVLASPKSIEVFSLKNSGFWTPA